LVSFTAKRFVELKNYNSIENVKEMISKGRLKLGKNEVELEKLSLIL